MVFPLLSQKNKIFTFMVFLFIIAIKMLNKIKIWLERNWIHYKEKGKGKEKKWREKIVYSQIKGSNSKYKTGQFWFCNGKYLNFQLKFSFVILEWLINQTIVFYFNNIEEKCFFSKLLLIIFYLGYGCIHKGY